MPYYLGNEVRSSETHRRPCSSSLVKSLWHTQLRSATASREAQKEGDAALNVETPVAARSQRLSPSSAEKSAGGLTDSTVYSSSSSSNNSRHSTSASGAVVLTPSEVRRRLRAAALLAERQCAGNPRKPIYEPVARPLFQKYLIREYEELSTCPVLTVVLDLDETLVSNRDTGAAGAILRPYCLHMLNALQHKKGLEVVLWTASTEDTASPVVQQLSQSGPVFDEVVCRNNLWFTEPSHTKDLRLLGRDMDRVIIFDNSTACCKLNSRSAVIVSDFRGTRSVLDASMVNVYYIIERVFRGCCAGISVSETLMKLAAERQLCETEVIHLPESWRRIPLNEVDPLKIPPHGVFFRCRSAPLDDNIMRHWTI
uniref:Mitochondrial import inner membrane translocase subunit TIM50 n=1 Tax=Trypanosoma congolense (strain IL3000) TaxID=1068625 RepID=G0V0D2_TRYCI|nr:conserved hypothetical protein [Trypanosoma congolense IL3000]